MNNDQNQDINSPDWLQVIAIIIAIIFLLPVLLPVAVPIAAIAGLLWLLFANRGGHNDE